jgi:hypothetical protein
MPQVLAPTDLQLGDWRPRLAPWSGLGLIIEGLDHPGGLAAPGNYIDDLLLREPQREPFLALIDRVGLVVCKQVASDHETHRDVRGRSSRGKLSQGEYYHHDGCSGPVKPRVVEIRCPYQSTPRHIATAIAPFPATVHAMLHELPPALVDAELAPWHARVLAGEPLPLETCDLVQGLLNRTLRRELDAESARAFFRAVDLRAGAYREPWDFGESRFIANRNPGRTMQHRRAYLEVHSGGQANGHLVKRWPAEEA